MDVSGGHSGRSSGALSPAKEVAAAEEEEIGGCKVVAELGPGQVMGELALANNDPRKANCVAVVPNTTVLVITRWQVKSPSGSLPLLRMPEVIPAVHPQVLRSWQFESTLCMASATIVEREWWCVCCAILCCAPGAFCLRLRSFLRIMLLIMLRAGASTCRTSAASRRCLARAL